VDGPEMVLADRFGNPQHATFTREYGTVRVPFAFPYGAVFVAWESRDVVDQWITRSGTANSSRTRVLATLNHIRRCGYSILGPAFASSLLMGEFVSLLRRAPVTQQAMIEQITAVLVNHDSPNWFLTDIEPALHYSAGLITAPIFGPTAQPRFVASLNLGGQELTGERLTQLAENLRDETQRITTLLDGAAPTLAALPASTRKGRPAERTGNSGAK
jgi:hypothetical protein